MNSTGGYPLNSLQQMKKLSVFFLPVTILVLASCGTLVIKNTSVLDTGTGKMLSGQTIVIENEMIVSRGPDDSAAVPLFSEVIDGRGKFVIPGLIDAHAHLIYILDSVNIPGEEALPLYLGTGVTSVRDIGDVVAGQKRLRDFASKHPETCPTVFMCSPLIEGAHPFHGDDPVSIPITDPGRVPGYIDSLAQLGVTTVKLYVHTDSAVYQKVVEEAHKRGITVSAHLPSNAVSTQFALDQGIDVIEHIFGAPEDSAMIAQMVKQGTMLDPTLVVFRNMLYHFDRPEVWKHKDNDYVSPKLRALWDAYRKNTERNGQTPEWRNQQLVRYQQLTLKLYKAGVPILAGSDSPEPYCPPGFSMHEEMLLLVQSGLSPAAAIASATLNNARALKQEKTRGSVDAGKVADLVILHEDPLSDIRNTRKIYRVIHRGIAGDPQKILPSP